ncbi:uncharacterized protein LOC129962330 [Argiope bruennichi]|uniref:uncharacterized protein LOC129962330 n=1 Tax=Argiope bruennichi TaxID=94029 RepID=UPI002493D46F|nr:uncharacterized protein LOC129962330 [Argiope bruennichi]
MGSLDWDKIVNDASVLRIQWKFNPPTAAWWGGFFESMIKMVKKLLRRVLGKASLHYEEMFTILCDVEANINSRPLNYLSEDPNDLIPLTPSMFIQETIKVGVPDLDTLDKNIRTVYHEKDIQYIKGQEMTSSQKINSSMDNKQSGNGRENA